MRHHHHPYELWQTEAAADLLLRTPGLAIPHRRPLLNLELDRCPQHPQPGKDRAEKHAKPNQALRVQQIEGLARRVEGPEFGMLCIYRPPESAISWHSKTQRRPAACTID